MMTWLVKLGGVSKNVHTLKSTKTCQIGTFRNSELYSPFLFSLKWSVPDVSAMGRKPISGSVE